jgi:hypothetical protein
MMKKFILSRRANKSLFIVLTLAYFLIAALWLGSQVEANSLMQPAPPTPPPGPGCNGTKNPCWLTRKTLGSEQETIAYYTQIGAIVGGKRDTLAEFIKRNEFDRGGDVRAIYYNAVDLALGRDMRCKRVSNGNIACYVTNYGPPPYTEEEVFLQDTIFLTPEFSVSPGHRSPIPFYPSPTPLIVKGRNPKWPDSNVALDDAINGRNAFATVAMEYIPPGTVNFYIYNQKGDLINVAALDGEGEKSVPQMCMACHGGSYNATSHTVTGASFLPFMPFYYRYSNFSPWTDQHQQEEFRTLNSLVKDTNPNQPIQDLVDLLYPSGLNNPGSQAAYGGVPSGWSSASEVYLRLVGPLCRTCHIASKTYPFSTSTQFQNSAGAIQTDLCVSAEMPHAQIPRELFQQVLVNSTAKAELQAMGVTISCLN